MSDRAASAAALLKAGNYEAAEREARALLARDPKDPDGLRLLFLAANRREENDKALELAENWVSQVPDSQSAHRNLIVALINCKKERRARAALDAFRNGFPAEKIGADVLETQLEAMLGKTDDAVERIVQLRKEYGPAPEFDRLEAVARARAGHGFAASRAIGRMLKDDPVNVDAIFLAAVSAFRLGRLWKARTLARRLRAVDPRQSAQANEIIFASYAACFPPFLVGHLFLVIINFMTSRTATYFVLWLVYAAGPLAAIPIVFLVEFLAERTGIPNFHLMFYLSALGWWVYAMFFFLKISKWRRKKTDVKLSPTY